MWLRQFLAVALFALVGAQKAHMVAKEEVDLPMSVHEEICGTLNRNRSIPIGGSCFVISNNAKRFDEAKTACTELPNGRLANLKTREQTDELWPLIQQLDEDLIHAWLIIGIVRPADEADRNWRNGWRYLDGDGDTTDDATAYTNALWRWGEPNGGAAFIKEVETRLIFDVDNDRQSKGQPLLYDHRPSTDLYLCEYLHTSSPSPSSIETTTTSSTATATVEVSSSLPQETETPSVEEEEGDENNCCNDLETSTAGPVEEAEYDSRPILGLLLVLLVATALSFVIWRRWHYWQSNRMVLPSSYYFPGLKNQNIDNDLDILVR